MPVDDRSAESAAAAETFMRAHRDCAGCANYHGLWPYLRLAGITRSQVDLEVVQSLIRAGVARGAHRILIAGAADALTTLAVLRALPSDVTTMLEVVDRCATPLETIRRALAPGERRVTLRQANLLDDSQGGAVDIALAHGLLGFFSDEDQVTLLQAIGRRFGAGSVLISSERVDLEMVGDGDNVPRYAERMIRRLGDARVALPVPESEFRAAMLQQGQDRLRTQGRFADEAAVVALLAKAGLAVRDMIDVGRGPIDAVDSMQRRLGRRVVFTASRAAVAA